MTAQPPESFLRDTSRRLNSHVFDRDSHSLKVLDQLLLPHEFKYIEVHNVEDGFSVIKKMQVRGAPMIATVGLLSIYIESFTIADEEVHDEWLLQRVRRLISSRPTAVNLSNALNELKNAVEKSANKLATLREFVLDHYGKEQEENRLLCWHGVCAVTSQTPKAGDGYTVMTICNTGSLATSSWGTALGVCAGLRDVGRLRRVIALETRPYNQGSRLTATELAAMGVEYVLITDSMAAAAMRKFDVDAVIVGADQVVANGDTANKIGTLNLAMVASVNTVPLYVALPRETYNPRAPTGASITIEERPDDEFRYFNGKLICGEKTPVWNPAFDVTPHTLIKGYITERGTLLASQL